MPEGPKGPRSVGGVFVGLLADFLDFRPGEVFPAVAGAFFSKKMTFLDFMTCIRLGEVFLAAAGAFLGNCMKFMEIDLAS